MIEYRILQSIDEFDQVVDLEILVWGLDPRDAVPTSIMRPLSMHGGLMTGAFDGARMVGLTVAFPARVGRMWVLWSHMAAVHPDLQGQGIGFRLKQMQRDWALANGYGEMRWTFDPLQRGNANFNLHQLGATASIYHVNHYGVMDDEINRDLPSDRIEAVWKLNDRRVKALADGKTPPILADIPPDALALSAAPDGSPVQAPDLSQPTVYAEMPRSRASFGPDVLGTWRLAQRNTLQTAFARGYVATDFVDTGERCFYILQAPAAWFLYVLECGDGSLYTGITPDVEKRLKLHQAGRGAAYTRGRGPLTLRGAWRFPNRVAAMKAEVAFKGMTRDAKLRHVQRQSAFHDGMFISDK